MLNFKIVFKKAGVYSYTDVQLVNIVIFLTNSASCDCGNSAATPITISIVQWKGFCFCQCLIAPYIYSLHFQSLALTLRKHKISKRGLVVRAKLRVPYINLNKPQIWVSTYIYTKTSSRHIRIFLKRQPFFTDCPFHTQRSSKSKLS